MLFRKGYTYIAGVDKPGLLTVGLIVDGVEAQGFRVMGVWACDELPALPPIGGVVGTCGNDYDYIGIAERTEPDAEIDLPSAVVWIAEFATGPNVLPTLPLPQPGAACPPPLTWRAVAIWSAIGAVVGAGAMHLAMR